jgi:hypothetical protein
VSESQEVHALRQYLLDSGVAHRVTSTIRHSDLTNAGYPSRHRQQGTNGMGLALDAAGPSPGWDTPQLAAIFYALLKVERQLHELIYAGPQVAFNIRNGARVGKYAIADHHDHVHVSVDKGVLIEWPDPPNDLDEEWWDYMPIFKSEQDKEYAYIRSLYLAHLMREPESIEAMDWYRLVLHDHGGDYVMALIADSDEAVFVRNQLKLHAGIPA